MRRLYAWIAGVAGGLTAYRLVTRRRGVPAELPSEPVGERAEGELPVEPEPAVEAPAEPDAGPDPRADELRAMLAESRDEGSPEAEDEAPREDPQERRRRVHERGRAAVDEMRGGEPGAGEP